MYKNTSWDIGRDELKRRFIYLKNMRDTVAFCPKYDIIAHEMNNMQNRISCVKCSVDGELPPKRKVRLTI